MQTIKLTIDNISVEVEEGTTVLSAAQRVGIHIPTLCHLHLEEMHINHSPSGCRVCVVEIKGRKNLAPSCATYCSEGMEVQTHNIRVLNARKTVLELILSDHPFECLVCAKSGNCDLQALAHEMGIRQLHYTGEQSKYKQDTSPAIIRDMDKCILCRRCEMMCNDFQTVGVLSGINRGFKSVVAPAFERNLVDSACTFCGQCVAVCPTGALTEVDHTNQIIRLLANKDKIVLVQTAPAVRAALGEAFGLPAGTLVTGKMVAALRRIGFDYVFDTDFAADLTIMEEGAELLSRLKRFLDGDKTVAMPMLTSCCPGWVNFIEHQFPEFIDLPSTAKSPQQMFGAIAKSYFAEKMGIDPVKIVVVSVMPCLAKKYECQREELEVDGLRDVDFALSTRELANLIRQMNIDFMALPDEEFDSPLGTSTGAAVIFGTTGGVIEAAVRTAAELYLGKVIDKIDYSELRGMEGIREATVNLNGFDLHIGIANGLGNARKLLESIKQGTSTFHAIEIMACPGGCIGGGGQPLHHGDASILDKRHEALYSEDERKVLRKSHENPDIKVLYDDFLGKPLGHKSHHYLHTCYFDKKKKNGTCFENTNWDFDV
jgi:NADP-reducing hydrogenase subunit HndD